MAFLVKGNYPSGGGMRHANRYSKRKWTWWEVHVASKQRVPKDESCNSDEELSIDNTHGS